VTESIMFQILEDSSIIPEKQVLHLRFNIGFEALFGKMKNCPQV